MTAVVLMDEFRRKKRILGWMEGYAECEECGRAWIAVAPVGSVCLQCPSCLLGKGAFRQMPAYPW